MKKIYIRGGKANNTAINIMKHHLEKLGHQVTRSKEDPFQVGLSWGVSYAGPKPFLNANVNRYDKYEAFDRFRKAGVPCPHTFPINAWRVANITQKDVLLARKRHHVKGKDIVVCKNFRDAQACEHTHDFFSVFIPTDTEFRVWVINGKAVATYEKQFKGAGEYDGFCRNRRFGFKFEKRDDLRGSHQIEGPAIGAVKALDMDWGAVDLLRGKDGRYYVLEVNSMPHIDSIGRSSGIRLAAAVSKWAEQQ